ncbi:RAB6A-GEF complex partner protein 2-like isoform X3 [Argiope bruennichi]|uniref:RAB6A-GEF complex partner protein 2-like isoform X3 n=1 Tax=Argiope bruennichi TaxID=94029 RepID=UPI002494494D|nr:RAB6A-GEF complex partner protein 2-like isoform X3 [Argiope bruennichi]
MMIEVHARLPHGSVFLTGEVVECHISFRSPFTYSQKQSQYNSDIEEVLAWASAQIHCQCTVDDTLVKFPSTASQEELATASQDTSFIPCESGHVVLSTKPKILFCDLKLSPGESKTYIYKETIPYTAPPSYRGQCVKYAYKITVGTQRVNAVIKLLKIPIRVLLVYGIPDAQFCADSEELPIAPANPFLQSQQKQPTISSALQILEANTARRNPSYYNITNQNGKVVRFCLLKSSYRLGEDIIGVFDFSQGTVKCVQFSVTLISEEELQENCKGRAKQGITTVAYNKHHEFSLHLNLTQVILPIPLTVTPTFTTNIVSLKWKLHFEFVTTTTVSAMPEPTSPSENISWQGPANLDVQTMIWDLPIKVFPTHPLQIAHGLPSKLDHMITI